MNVLADKGYATGRHIDLCNKNGIKTFVSRRRQSPPAKDVFPTERFIYDKDKDCYICPAGKELKPKGKPYTRGEHTSLQYSNYEACENCQLKKQCTKSKKGRAIHRSVYQEALEENEARVRANPEYYKQRQQIIEHVFGTLKRQWNFTYTLMRGKRGVATEVSIIMICYNLRRLLSIFGTEELINKLKELVLFFILALKCYYKGIRYIFFVKIKQPC